MKPTLPEPEVLDRHLPTNTPITRGYTWKTVQRLIDEAYAAGLEDAAKAAETQLDEAEEARSDKAFKDAYAVGSEDEAVSRGRHWMTVSTCNAVVRNCARAIRSLKEGA